MKKFNEVKIYGLSNDSEMLKNTKDRLKYILTTALSNIDTNSMFVIIVTDYTELNKLNLMCTSNLSTLATLKASEIISETIINSVESLKEALAKEKQ